VAEFASACKYLRLKIVVFIFLTKQKHKNLTQDSFHNTSINIHLQN